MEKILNLFMILKTKEDKNVHWDMILLFPSLDLWLWIQISPKLSDSTLGRSTEEINQSWQKEDTESFISVILTFPEHMILWFLMLKFWASCKKFCKLWTLKNMLLRLTIEKSYRQWFMKLDARFKISKLFAALLTN